MVKPDTPTRRKSLKVISKPATKRISMPPISPKAWTISFISIRGVPFMLIIEPRANGPRMMPANSSPKMDGILIFVNSSPSIFAEKTSMHIVTVALRTRSSSAIGCVLLLGFWA